MHKRKTATLLNALGICFAFIVISLMYYRAIWGAGITDEAYYVAEAKEILNGNVLYAYNNSSKAAGFTIPLVLLEAVYGVMVPNLEGVFLYTRICFVTYKVLIFLIVFITFRRRTPSYMALLISSMILPISGYLPNFSYNTIPELNLLASGCLLYDSLEQDAPGKWARFALAGALCGVACLANPGWGLSLIIFLMLIVLRSDTRTRIRNAIWFCGSIIVLLILLLFIVDAKAGFKELIYGFYRLFFSPIPVDKLVANKNWIGIFISIGKPIMRIFIVLMLSFVILSLVGRYLANEWKVLCNPLNAAVDISLCINIIYVIIVSNKQFSLIWEIGLVAICYEIILLIINHTSDNRIIMYLGIYQPLYSLSCILLLSEGAGIGRFICTFTCLIPVAFIVLKKESRLLEVYMLLVVALVLSYTQLDYSVIYNDRNINELSYVIRSGVYKGIRTTKEKAYDLPELENYLNDLIGKDENYAFRDNVPSAYLMVHKGKVCEISTWDILQHSYHRNSPAVLFDYYRRRDMIPDKIIYIDFGRDENLSIVEENYRYNDWVNAYYDLVEDIELNETYFHVMVYQYNGTFNGDYQWWIKNYWDLVK